MVTVSDLLKILDKVPIWKNLKGLPQRVEALEARIKELEASKQAPGCPVPCPQCGSRQRKITASRPDPVLTDVGAKRRDYVCEDCGYEDKDIVDPTF